MAAYKALRNVEANGREFAPGDAFAPDPPLRVDQLMELVRCGAIEATGDPEPAPGAAAEPGPAPQRRRGR